MAVQDGPTSIRVTWTPPSPLGDTLATGSPTLEEEAAVTVWMLMVATLAATL